MLRFNHRLRAYARNLGREFEGVAKESLDKLECYSWPGNVRELQNVIERAAILSKGPLLKIKGSFDLQSNHETTDNLEHVERAHIIKVLNETNWVIEGDNGAAMKLGLNPSTLRSRLRKLEISREE